MSEVYPYLQYELNTRYLEKLSFIHGVIQFIPFEAPDYYSLVNYNFILDSSDIQCVSSPVAVSWRNTPVTDPNDYSTEETPCKSMHCPY